MIRYLDEMMNSITKQSRVAIVRASAATILSDYERLLHLVGVPDIGTKHARVQIAIDRRYPFPGSSAPPWQTDGVGRALAAHGVVRQAYQLSRPDSDDWHGHRAVANSLGMVNSYDTQETEPRLVVLLASLRRGPHRPCGGTTRLWPRDSTPQAILAVLDATTIGNGPPGTADNPELGNHLLASNDPAALDEVACALLGIDHECRHNRIPPEYELLGDTNLLGQRWLPILSGRRARLAARLGRQHWEFERWTTRDQQIYTSWLSDTEWGRLFRIYRREHKNE